MDIRTWIIFLIVWGISVYVIVPKLNNPIDVNHSNTIKRTNMVLKQLHNFSEMNLEMFNFIDNYLNNSYKLHEHLLQKKFIEKLEYQLEQIANVLSHKNDPNSFYGDIQLSPDYLQIRRRIKQNTQEMWNYFSSEIGKIQQNQEIINDTSEQIRTVLNIGIICKRSIISNIDRMRSVDGYEIWRQKESEDLSYLVQRRLSYIQNPKDCKNAKKLLCQLQECGFGCQIHHVVYCLIVANAVDRTMVLNSYDWNYHEGGWEEIFQAVSKTCTKYNMKVAEVWPGSIDTNVLMLPAITSVYPKPSFLFLATPEDLLPRIIKLNSDPSVWWIGQFLKYLFKPKHEEILEISKEILDWKKPIVGIHIRRTDKVGTEATYHSVEEYMTYAEDYYLTLEMDNQNVERRIYLAADDPQVITEVRTKYPHYTIIGDLHVAEAAFSTRYTKSSLNGIITDILILSLSHYLICTFSSNVCRTAYEIMQNHFPDASDRFKSLDFIYYFDEKNDRDLVATLSHKPRNKDEMSLTPGDLMNSLGNHWNGFTKGNNMRVGKIGLFPSFKVKDIIKKVKILTHLSVD